MLRARDRAQARFEIDRTRSTRTRSGMLRGYLGLAGDARLRGLSARSEARMPVSDQDHHQPSARSPVAEPSAAQWDEKPTPWRQGLTVT